MSGTACEELAKELTAQGLKVFVPKFGVQNLTQFRKRVWEILCLAFKYPKSYPTISRRNREDPTRTVKSIDSEESPSRQIHAQRREAIQLNILAWLSTAISLTTWQLKITAKELKETLRLGVKRIPRALKEIDGRGLIHMEKSGDVFTITATEVLWESVGIKDQAIKTRNRMLSKERSEDLQAKAKERRVQEAEEKQQRKEERREEIKAESASGHIDSPLQRQAEALMARYPDMPEAVVRQIRRSVKEGSVLPEMTVVRLIDYYKKHPP